MADGLLSIAEACEALGLGKRTVQRLIASGELPVVKFGRRTLVDPRDVRALIARHRTPAEMVPVDVKPSPGQIRALHGKASELDRRTGEKPRTWKRVMLDRASSHFGQELRSANDLSPVECDWVLDELTEELAKL